MVLSFSDQQKLELLNSVPDKTVYSLSRHDIQAEAIRRYGRLLNNDEIEKAEKMLEWGIGENLNGIYGAVFSEIGNKK